jgi:hypothetical protein
MKQYQGPGAYQRGEMQCRAEKLARVRPIEDVLLGLARKAPQEDWEKLPSDLTDNLDHHLYGTPKK